MTHLKERNLLVVILLFLFTFGIYPIYLFFVMHCELISEGERMQAKNRIMHPLAAICISIVTCGIYSLFYTYFVGKLVQELAEQRGLRTMDPIAYVLLNFVSLGYFFQINDISTIAATYNDTAAVEDKSAI